jgi:hypothetical protein
MHFDPYLTGTGIGHWKTRQHEGAACLHYLHGSHGRFTHIVLLEIQCDRGTRSPYRGFVSLFVFPFETATMMPMK